MVDFDLKSFAVASSINRFKECLITINYLFQLTVFLNPDGKTSAFLRNTGSTYPKQIPYLF